MLYHLARISESQNAKSVARQSLTEAGLIASQCEEKELMEACKILESALNITLGVSKEAPVGFQHIRLRFELDINAPVDKVATLIRLTERYCVVYQTLQHSPNITVSIQSRF